MAEGGGGGGGEGGGGGANSGAAANSQKADSSLRELLLLASLRAQIWSGQIANFTRAADLGLPFEGELFGGYGQSCGDMYTEYCLDMGNT